jgi:hypothetical protein
MINGQQNIKFIRTASIISLKWQTAQSDDVAKVLGVAIQ